MPNVCILPSPKLAPDGLNRVLTAMFSRLPKHGWNVVESPEAADICNYHVMAYAPHIGKPMIHSSHGLHWADCHDEMWQWPLDLLRCNRRIVDIMCEAQAVTVPSDWVNAAIRRGVLRRPETIYHGVDADMWRPLSTPGKYVLWNKARADIGCNPAHVTRLAGGMPDVQFVSTFGAGLANLKVLGPQPPARMVGLVQNAGVYLATTRETFGIGTLEALACGVPVVGWRWGGQAEIIIDGETGKLATPGDYDELADAVRWAMANRPKLSEAARADAVARWGWEPRIAQYAALFSRVLADWQRPRPTVSVLVTCHNLGRYLADCLSSIARQSLADWECLIVDDASTDDTAEVAARFSAEDQRFVYLRTPANLKLSGARNYGAARASGRYIIPVDADDMLTETALAQLAGFLDAHPEIHIAYGHLDIISDDGTGRRRNDWPFQFNWMGQMAHLNQLPYASMMRREVLEESGGYRVRDWRAEDASLWCRVTSFGFRAHKATEDATLLYRIRGDSKSAQERTRGYDDGDWTSWFPWRLGATTGPDGAELMRQKRPVSAELVPFGAQGNAPHGCWPVWSHDKPAVTVIVPVGPAHTDAVIDALDSVMAQTRRDWECVVVNDSGKALNLPHPWARVVQSEHRNIAHARNLGIEAARAPLLIFLDADDIMLPDALQLMLAAYVSAEGARYIYTDWFNILPDGSIERKKSLEYDQAALKGMHPIMVLVERAWAQAVGGFDPELPGWEDWDFFVKLAINGYCGQRLAEPLLGYRIHAGERREQSLRDAGETLPQLSERYGEFVKGQKKMAGCCGGSGVADAIMAAKRVARVGGAAAAATDEGRPANTTPPPSNGSGLVRVRWLGKNLGAVQMGGIAGKRLTRTYRFGRGLWEYADCPPEDAALLVQGGRCEYVVPPSMDIGATAVLPSADTSIPISHVQPAGEFPAMAAERQAPVFQEEPEPEPVVFDVGEATAAKVLEYAIGKDSAEIRRLLAAEGAGKARSTVIARLQRVLADAERVG